MPAANSSSFAGTALTESQCPWAQAAKPWLCFCHVWFPVFHCRARSYPWALCRQSSGSNCPVQHRSCNAKARGCMRDPPILPEQGSAPTAGPMLQPSITTVSPHVCTVSFSLLHPTAMTASRRGGCLKPHTSPAKAVPRLCSGQAAAGNQSGTAGPTVLGSGKGSSSLSAQP